jgi:hypothetical protein
LTLLVVDIWGKQNECAPTKTQCRTIILEKEEAQEGGEALADC